MVNRHNYHLVKEFLLHQQDNRQLEPRSITRYWFYLKFLLLWADEILFNQLASIRPGFAIYLSTTRLDGREGSLDTATLKKIIQTVKRKGRGFRNFLYFQTMIYLVASKLTFDLPSPVPIIPH